MPRNNPTIIQIRIKMRRGKMASGLTVAPPNLSAMKGMLVIGKTTRRASQTHQAILSIKLKTEFPERWFTEVRTLNLNQHQVGIVRER